eukprot:TRINITY_DN80989_c3_g1_i3.p2 TRINITY_DN80989_c3_g1~~TRINITY_DN80989_c3_g1_i3.p2  ORF type:complete len:221 (-),score=27.39 TRINITY_DN80989_c3_g1_i3:82-744(-)
MERDPILTPQRQNNNSSNNIGSNSNSSSSTTSTKSSTSNQMEEKNRVQIMSSVQEEITMGMGVQRSQGLGQGYGEGSNLWQGQGQGQGEEIVVHPDLENNDFLDFRYRKKHLEPLHIEKWTIETEHKAEREWRRNVYRMVCVAVCVFLFLLAVGLIWDFAARGNKSSKEEDTYVFVPSCTYPMPGDSSQWIRPISYDLTLFFRKQQFYRELDANIFVQFD